MVSSVAKRRFSPQIFVAPVNLNGWQYKEKEYTLCLRFDERRFARVCIADDRDERRLLRFALRMGAPFDQIA